MTISHFYFDGDFTKNIMTCAKIKIETIDT